MSTVVNRYAESNKGNESEVDTLKSNIRQSRALERMNKDETLKLRQKHIGSSVALFFQDNPLKIVRGGAQYLYDELGNEYLDCINNVAHVGHANKRVAEAVGQQMQILNTNARFLHDNLSLYAKRLVSTMPAHLSVCYLVNSGSEANDLAIRLARAHTKRKDLVCVDGAYHGNLTSTMSISPYKTDKLDRSSNWTGCNVKWAHIAPMPCSYRGKFNTGNFDKTNNNNQQVGQLYAAATKQLIDDVQSKKGRQVAAMFVESMISCGGQFPLPSGYLRNLQKYLHANGSLMVCDEVQTGFGRSGKHMWAFQLDGDDIKPDIVTLGKPMGNGFPVAAVVTSPDIANSFREIGTEYFNTFGGNPVSCAAALAVLDEIQELQLVSKADQIGSYILDKLNKMQENYAIVGDVRGFGFFIGIDIVEDKSTRAPAPAYAKYIVQRFRDERILMSTEGKHGNVLKFKPPMVFTMDNANRFLEVLEKALAELSVKGLLSSLELIGSLHAKKSSSTASSASSTSSSSWLESSSEQDF